MDQSSSIASTATRIRISVNGEMIDVVARTLADLVAEQGYGEARIATALNGEFVPVRLRAETPLAPGDRVEVVAPRQGG